MDNWKFLGSYFIAAINLISFIYLIIKDFKRSRQIKGNEKNITLLENHIREIEKQNIILSKLSDLKQSEIGLMIEEKNSKLVPFDVNKIRVVQKRLIIICSLKLADNLITISSFSDEIQDAEIKYFGNRSFEILCELTSMHVTKCDVSLRIDDSMIYTCFVSWDETLKTTYYVR